ncbi:MAG: hypothetical protein IJ774_07455 [Selenomonadaceae bacterium]|nr:hypothetical protein [Selenomonadaceae bacterium]
MRKLVIFALMMFVTSFANTVSAYNWHLEYDFPARRIVLVPDGDNFDHIIYSFTNAQGRPSLLFVCHGAESDGVYYAYMGGKFYSNYAHAVDNEIRYHINRGEIKQNSFEQVYFLTCHAGYAAQREVVMPFLNKPLKMAIYNKSVQGLKEYFDSQWRVNRVVLLQDHPYVPGDLDSNGSEIFDDVIIAGDSQD